MLILSKELKHFLRWLSLTARQINDDGDVKLDDPIDLALIREVCLILSIMLIARLVKIIKKQTRNQRHNISTDIYLPNIYFSTDIYLL